MSMAQDLMFYFNNNLFARSNFFDGMQGSSYIKLSKIMGQATFNDSYTDAELRKVKKYSKIAIKYNKLPSIQRRQLAAIFDYEYQYRYPPEFRLLLLKKAGTAFWITDAKTTDELIKIFKAKSNHPSLEIKATTLYSELELSWKSI